MTWMTLNFVCYQTKTEDKTEVIELGLTDTTYTLSSPDLQSPDPS